LRSNPFDDALTRVRPRLGRLATAFHFYPTIGSTNDHALLLATEGAVVVADSQTAGRGRRGHSWFSPPGSGLYVSVVLTPRRAEGDAQRATSLVTIMAGVALAEGIGQATGLEVVLKWPNDLFVGQRKLGGILAESSGSTAIDVVVVGYGINVAATAFPRELSARATSLESELGREIDRAFVLAETLSALARRYDDLLAGRFDAILDGWRLHAPASRGALVSWTTPDGVFSGQTAGIDAQGALLVRRGDAIERIVAGEVNWMDR
jgi:BirA family biotin operon repressor/biotin-[acetyl-CoA-carboxylase] ligase